MLVTDDPSAGLEEQFGVFWSPSEHLVTRHLYCYAHGLTEEQGALGKDGHFWALADLFWGAANKIKQFIRTPWAEKMISAAHEHKYLAVAGCASAGKTDTYAVYALINWWANPVGTMVLVTSTSLKEARGRVWGSLEDYFNAAQKHFGDALPGKLVSSVGLIKLDDPNLKTSERSGIRLVAGEKGKEKESIGKLIGLKNDRVFFIADELAELSPALLEAAFSNLDSNLVFQLVGISNPNSIYDPFGLFAKPKDGWKSITPASLEWTTEKGHCIRFDAYQSPNVLAGRTIYKWLPTQAKIDEKKNDLGEESLAFWRMWRGYFCPTGGTESVIAEADIVGFNCERPTITWKPHTLQFALSFLDPGFTNGGDRSIAYFAIFGLDSETEQPALLYGDYVPLFENTMNKSVSRNYQIVHAWRDECVKRGVTPDHSAVDDTGASSFGDIVHMEWSRLVTRINFGGKATKLQVSATEKTLACDKYANRVTEIWCSMREYMRGGQIRGICPDLGTELTARRMVSRKSGLDLKAQVEPKPVMRSRTGKSPDIADAALGILDFCRAKYKFQAMARVKLTSITNKDWKKFVKKNDLQSRHGQYLDRAA